MKRWHVLKIKHVALLGLVGLLSGPAHAGSFQFGAILRAGITGNSVSELLLGPDLNNNSMQGQLNPYWAGPAGQMFEIGYTSSTNSAFIKVHQTQFANSPSQGITWSAGGPGMDGNANWTLPFSSFFVNALLNPGITGIAVTKLRFLTPATVLSGIQETAMIVGQANSGPSVVSQSADVVFKANGNGDWTLAGNIFFFGLTSRGGTASGDDLSFNLGAYSSHAPEPATLSMMTAGLASLIAFARRRRKS